MMQIPACALHVPVSAVGHPKPQSVEDAGIVLFEAVSTSAVDSAGLLAQSEHSCLSICISTCCAPALSRYVLN